MGRMQVQDGQLGAWACAHRQPRVWLGSRPNENGALLRPVQFVGDIYFPNSIFVMQRSATVVAEVVDETWMTSLLMLATSAAVMAVPGLALS